MSKNLIARSEVLSERAGLWFVVQAKERLLRTWGRDSKRDSKETLKKKGRVEFGLAY